MYTWQSKDFDETVKGKVCRAVYVELAKRCKMAGGSNHFKDDVYIHTNAQWLSRSLSAIQSVICYRLSSMASLESVSNLSRITPSSEIPKLSEKGRADAASFVHPSFISAPA
jgi:hypothetical protein